MTPSRSDLEDFLYHEADLLDRWELEAWLALFTPGATYRIPPLDRPDADPELSSFLIDDDRRKLEQRVTSLLKRSAHAEWPHSRTRRMITNVRIVASNGDRLDVRANFTVHRVRRQEVATYIGRYEHALEVTGDGLRIHARTAVLDHEALRPEGKISIIL